MSAKELRQEALVALFAMDDAAQVADAALKRMFPEGTQVFVRVRTGQKNLSAATVAEHRIWSRPGEVRVKLDNSEARHTQHYRDVALPNIFLPDEALGVSVG